MQRNLRPVLACFAVIAACGAPALASAADLLSEPEANLAAGDGRTAPLSSDDLAETSGGENVAVQAIAQQRMRGVTEDNTVDTGGGDYASGDVSFASGAMTGFSGVNNMVVNTGANNTVMGAISVTIASGN